MKKIFTFLILLLVFILIGCRSTIKYIPDENYLPDAYKNKPYHELISINGGKVIDSLFWFEITPLNSGLTVEPDEEEKHGEVYTTYNRVKIQGIPKVSGDIKLKIGGGTFGTNFPGVDFEKNYIIKVK